MPLSAKDIAYFEHRQDKAREFVARFPGGINFRGKRVLDIGCGHGALSLHAANEGAAEVMGLDVSDKLLDMANELLQDRFTNYQPVVSFHLKTIEELDDKLFDIILSQATFEHILDPASCLAAVKKRLVPGANFIWDSGPSTMPPSATTAD
ncbi:MAG: class I SAM-dependent methyltransferase [Candidatus Omnitrophica bacterium]|nr:class I SAM-dependent methyltransferase [Candidatus Omnitrophota bacterium]